MEPWLWPKGKFTGPLSCLRPSATRRTGKAIFRVALLPLPQKCKNARILPNFMKTGGDERNGRLIAAILGGANPGLRGDTGT